MKVSVYCLVYNHEQYVRSALEGFVNQITTFDYEVFVHDDASTDASAKIIQEYAEKYPEIIKPIYQTVNQYSRGIDFESIYILPKLSGEYIAVCEGDDYWTDPSKLQRQVDFLDSHPDYVACVHNTVLLDMKSGTEKIMYEHSQDEDITFLEAAQGGRSAFQTSSLMYRMQYANNDPDFFEKAEVDDYPRAMYLTLSGKVRFLNRVMSVYRLGTQSSWTMQNTLDMSLNARGYQRNVELLEAVNKYSSYKYNDEISKLILKNKYLILYFNEDYAALRTPPYREIYLTMGKLYRVKTYIKQYFKNLYHFYRRLTYGGK